MKILSVIIPCYNESVTITTILERILALTIPNWQIEVIVVDDGSRDTTRDVLRKYQSRVKTIYHSQNEGKGAAVKTGIGQASGDYILIQDADLEYDPSEIHLLLEALERGAGEVIFGSRNLHHVKRKGMYIPRIGVWFITKQFNLLYRTKLTDIWTCYKLFPREAGIYFSAGKFESELLFTARVVKKGLQIAEVPISHKPRTIDEGKKIRYRDGVIGICVLIREFFSK